MSYPISVRVLSRLGAGWLPFADAASERLPLPRLLRLGLFQVSVGLTIALLVGTLNRVLIVELVIAAGLVAAFIAVPMMLAPVRAYLGFRSDMHRSSFGWKRVPYLWFGTFLQFGGLAVMPFALLLLNGHQDLPLLHRIVGLSASGLAFLMLGLGAHAVQTTGLALATDLSAEDQKPRVVAFLYVSFLIGMLLGGLVYAAFLQDFTNLRLIQVISLTAVAVVVLNVAALWKQEPRDPERAAAPPEQKSFRESWKKLTADRRSRRLLWAVAIGSGGFAMQEVLLEPYGGQVLALGVGATSALTALSAAGAVAAFALAARTMSRRWDPLALAAWGAGAGVFAFALVVLAPAVKAATVLYLGALLLGFGGGLFAVGTLTAATTLDGVSGNGLAVGVWGALYATSGGVALAAGGLLRDLVDRLALASTLGPGLTGPEVGYLAVYHLEILVLFAAMAALGPLVRRAETNTEPARRASSRFGLAQLPG